MPKREKLPRIDEHITESVTIETGDAAMGIGPATCSVSTTNASTALTHTHQVTTDSTGAVYPCILASDSDGDLTLSSELTAYQVTADYLVINEEADLSCAITSNITYQQDLKVIRGGATYTAYPFVYLGTALTAPAWNGFHTHGDDGTIDVSVQFGAPAGIKAALLKVVLSDGAVDDIVGIGPTYAAQTALEMHQSVSGISETALAVVPCNANGDLCVYCAVGGSIYIDLNIWGYAL